MELLVTTALMGILGTGMAATMHMTTQWSSEMTEEAALQNEVRSTLDRMASELRQAYTGDGTAVLSTMTATQITFTSPDRSSPFHLRRISYRVSGGRLERAFVTSSDSDGPPWSIGALGSWIKQLSGVTSTTVFTYKDEDGATTTTASQVARVDIAITVKSATTPYRTFSYSTSVGLRAQAPA
jgi:type II secretory pathway component PulJ